MIIISACPRSGTKMISRVLNQCGLDVGHEYLGKDGIVSWRFLGDQEPNNSYLDQFTGVMHQIRSPLSCISSLHTLNRNSWSYIRKVIPIIENNDSNLLKCMKMWFYWNSKLSKISSYSYLIDNIDGTLVEILSSFGYNINVDNFLYLCKMNKGIHSRNHWPSYVKVSWKDCFNESVEYYCLIRDYMSNV